MKAYERFLNYVKIHTTSTEESLTHPSFAGEFNLAKLLVDELKTLGISDAFVDEKCYVYGHLPATEGLEDFTKIGFIAHMDTAPDASGENVNPILHENYDGNELLLGNSGRILSPEKFPFLKDLKGKTLITSDGTTLLGADDKAGVAEIMTLIEELVTNSIPHGQISIAFTPDEEIGEGADFFNLKVFDAEYAYTVDGGDIDCIEYENFNAASAKVICNGTSVHPGDAKNVMVNSMHLAMEFHSMLPAFMVPEHTEKREGFIHLTDMKGRVSQSTLEYIIRDHDMDLFNEKKKIMVDAAAKIKEKYGDDSINLTIEDSYFNMIEKIRPHMHLVENAKAAISSVGLSPVEVPIRGGTDGARLSFMGLPCPNLGTGGYNFHGEYECITVEHMDLAVEILIYLCGAYLKTPQN